MKALRLCLFFAIVSVSTQARAGIVKDYIDIVYLTPFVGAEVGRVGYAGLGTDSTTGVPTLGSGHYVFEGLTYGGLAGFRIGGLSIGALYQRTNTTGAQNLAVDFNKLYGEIGLNIRTSFIMTILHFDFGWSFFDQAGIARQDGFGAKVGIALEFYPVRVLSLGAGADFDGQGFVTKNNGVIGAYGGTFVARVGLHL